MLVLCWVLVLVWLQAGFLAALALAAFTDLAITLAAGFRSRRRSAGLKTTRRIVIGQPGRPRYSDVWVQRSDAVVEDYTNAFLWSFGGARVQWRLFGVWVVWGLIGALIRREAIADRLITRDFRPPRPLAHGLRNRLCRSVDRAASMVEAEAGERGLDRPQCPQHHRCC